LIGWNLQDGGEKALAACIVLAIRKIFRQSREGEAQKLDEPERVRRRRERALTFNDGFRDPA
jgi:hypothetical protein